MKNSTFQYRQPFDLESGVQLNGLDISYTTYGKLNQQKDNVVWVFHALTANQNPFEWWPGLFGNNDYFNDKEYFIVCANVIGGCYGSTGPANISESAFENGNFPLITVRDIARANRLIQDHLNISKIKIAIGGSFGGYQALEFAYDNPEIDHLIIVAAGAIETPWNIAIHQAQRLAMQADANFDIANDSFSNGLIAARGIGMLTYRTSGTFVKTQPRKQDQIESFAAASYIQYQGEKLQKRFSPWTYYKLTQTLDTHDIGRHRNGLSSALKKIKAKTLAIGIKEDILSQSSEVSKMANEIPKGTFKEISSDYGHDGFLLETKQLTQIINQFLN